VGEERLRCKDGVYHSLFDIAMGEPDLIKLISGEGDIFDYCGRFDEEDRAQCLTSSSTLVMAVNNNDFGRSTVEIKRRLGQDGTGAIRQMAGYQAYRVGSSGDFKESITACKNLGGSLSDECIRGLVEGPTDFGAPGEEEVAVTDFCNNESFDSKDKSFCFEHAVEYFGIYFGNEKKLQLCKYSGIDLCR
jgi:hypothetical protein